MILDLATKVNQLEQKCYELSRTQKQEKKQIMNDNPPLFLTQTPKQTTEKWLKTIIVTEKNVFNILNDGFEKEIVKIIVKSINEEESPFIIYDSDIYIYNCKRWGIIKSNSQIIEDIVQKIQNEALIVYQNQHENNHNNDKEYELEPGILNILAMTQQTMSDADCREYTSNITKLMTANISKQQVFDLLKNT